MKNYVKMNIYQFYLLKKEALKNIAETTVDNLTRFFRDGTCENELCYRCGKIEHCKNVRSGKCF